MTTLTYTIDKASSDKDSALVIKIQEAKKNNFLYEPTTARPLTIDLLTKAQESRDLLLLKFFSRARNFIRKKHQGRSWNEQKATFNYVHIAPSSTAALFRLFAVSGKVYYNEKPLVIDLFGKTEFYYSVEGQNIFGYLKTNKETFPLSSCDFIGRGPPHWFIKGISLKMITTDVSWSELQGVLSPLKVSLNEILSEEKNNPEAPRVVLNKAVVTPSDILNEKSPLPILILKDRFGAFANLFIDYEEGAPLILYGDPLATLASTKKRRLDLELNLEKDLLETDFIKKETDSSRYYCPIDKIGKSLAFLLEVGWQVKDASNNQVLLHQKASISAKDHSDRIIIKGKVSYGEFDVDLKSLVGAFNKKENFAQITPGYVALLPTNWENFGLDSILEDGIYEDGGICIRKNNIEAFSHLFTKQEDLVLDSSLQEFKNRIETFQKIETAPPGPLFSGKLRPYQQEGLNWLSFLYDFNFHGMLADDMGLGKTVQVLAFLSRIASLLTAPVLIVVPTSLIFNWKHEIEKFIPGCPVIIYQGVSRTAEELFQPSNDKGLRILLTSYAVLRLDSHLFLPRGYSCLILDEAGAIKNAHTQIFEVVSKLQAGFRLSITGTPIENNLSELWSHFRFLIPDLLGNEATFYKELQAGQSDERYLDKIKRKIHPFILRRMKTEVAKDLPEKIEQVVWIEMGQEQQKSYDSFLSGVRQKFTTSDGSSKSRMEILEAIMRLRQICCDPLLVGEETPSAKLNVVIEDIKTALEENRKVLVYSQFTSMLTLIAKQLKALGRDFVYLDGSTKNREETVNRFQEDPNTLVFLISLKAGGVGLNLTAADYVFLYDPWWNNAAENQAIDRAHRIGRKETVIAKRYIIRESIEEKIMRLKEMKSSLAADLIDDHGVPASLSIDDLYFLIN